MGKLIPITITGVVFQVEPEAYERLSDYLSEIRKHYFQQQNHSILLEVESKILEILNLRTNTRANSVKYLDVLDLIQTIGHVSDAPEVPIPPRVDLEIDPVESIPIFNAHDQNFTKKKRQFGRAVTKRKISGVAEGIGIYFGIDPVFVRLIFLALLFLKGSAILVYLILIVAMPNYSKEEEIPFKRRIMRDPDDKVMGGVAAGLAKYFGLDPVFLRVFFIFSILLGGTGILAYIILWIISPMAQSPGDKAAMKGRPIAYYIDSLIKKDEDQPDSASSLSKWLILIYKKCESAYNYLKSKKVLYGVAQVVFIGIVAYLLLSNLASPSFNFTYNDDYQYDFFNFKTWSEAKKISIALLVGIPALLIFVKIFESLFNRKLHVGYLKRGLLLAWLIVVFLVGFKGYLLSNSGLEGNGIITIENYDVERFNSIQVDGEFELEIRKGNKPSVQISTDENLSKYIKVESEEGKLRIHPMSEFEEATQLKIMVTAVNFEELLVSGQSKVTIDSISSPIFTIRADGESELRAKLFVGNLLLNQSGSGRYYLQGNATNATINSSGQFDLDAFNMESTLLNLNLDGEGTTKVNVKENLNVVINGQSQVLYKGQPLVDQEINGDGSINRVD